ncbi:Abnormal spindle-like microcephaly-associated protein-like [Stylophora pistillata]|uniref:Abnormal spindle-like microcephaly-associated protein-like n=1 Tax=Stylophora pistillata TaxID=50429 RepID=A0A2B4RFY4_STYPI|nr:Abnormal spindle-like microcephaly-associated protein-like [Stylophora pistillata]
MMDPSLTPVQENYPQLLVNKVDSKRAQWYSPCKNFPKLPLSPEPDPPTLKLTHFAAVPKISFGTVKVGSSKTEPFVVQNPHPSSQSLVLEKFPKDKGFTLDLNGNGMAEDSEGNCLSIPPNEETFLSIKWEPKESGNCREVILFKWHNSPRLQVVVFGTALGPKKIKSATKKIVKKSGPKKISRKPQESKRVARAILQPSQVPNTHDSKEKRVTVIRKLDGENIDYENAPVENLPEENERRDTYSVTNNEKLGPLCKTSPSIFTSKLTKPATKPVSGKTKKTAVPKKISPISGPLKKKPKTTVKLKVAAKGVAQRKLQLVKTPKTKLPRHPMPFAAKNMYYDERWIEKQEEGFTKWLNFVLTPPDVTDSEVQADASRGNMILGGTQDIKKSQPLAPTKEALSLRAYTARRKMARLRRCACLLYQSEPLGYIIRKIEAEVENGRFTIRPDKKLHADLGIKKQVTDMILSYNPLWLRIGLETIFGEILPIHSNDDVNGLRRFITDRLLGNPDIATAFAHPQVPGLYREGYVEQLGKFTLKKFLLLVLFLDRAKLTRLIDHDPCLFNKDASFKSNRSLLLTFSREYLKGEGDVTKHLNFLGYSVTHSQRPIDEVDYAVKNIAIDLRDGLRLTRVVELLTHNWQLSASLRVPAISRLQKIHNVDLFINALKQRGILVGGIHGGAIDARHIVDGHREKTLALLWQIIFHFQVNVLLSEKLLKEEIAHLESTRLLRDQLTAAENWIEGDEADFVGKRRDSSDLYFQSDRLRLLFKWCKMVCRLYGLKVRELGGVPLMTKASDMSYTIPDEKNVAKIVVSIQACARAAMTRRRFQAMRHSAVLVQSVFRGHLVRRQLRAHRQAVNCIQTRYLAFKKGREVLEWYRSLRKSVLRLQRIVLANQKKRKGRRDRAAKVGQSAWRGFAERRKFVEQREACIRIQAFIRGVIQRRRFLLLRNSTVLIQRIFRALVIERKERKHYLHLRKCVILLQSLYRGMCDRKRVKQIRAVITIQSHVRAWQTRTRFVSMKHAATMIQANVRMYQTRKKFARVKSATRTLQVHIRAALLGRKEKIRYMNQKSACIKIQSLIRCDQQRKVFLKKRKAIVMIQSIVRKCLARSRYGKLLSSTVKIQRRFREFLYAKSVQKKFVHMKLSALKIQSYYRGYRCRKEFTRVRLATVTLQSLTRRFLSRKKFLALTHAAVVIQTHYRALQQGRRQRVEYNRILDTIVQLQALVRGNIGRRRLMAQHRSATLIQTVYRGYVSRTRYRSSRQAAINIQRRYRSLLLGRHARSNFQRLQLASMQIQSYFRGFRARKQVKRLRSAVKIQAAYRGYQSRKSYNISRNCIIHAQAFARGYLTRKYYYELKKATVMLQSRYRARVIGMRQYVNYHVQRGACIVIQAAARGYHYRKRYLEVRNAAIVIQRKYKATVNCRSQRERYLASRRAAIHLQACVRGWLDRRLARRVRAARLIEATFKMHKAREEFLAFRRAVVRIQAQTRMIQQRQRFISLKKASLVIQRRYRATILCKHDQLVFHFIRGAVITLQMAIRGYLVRTKLRNMNDAAVKIQACFRGFQAWRRYEATKRAVLILQLRWRAWLLGRAVARNYNALKSSSLIIQSSYRHYKVRLNLKRNQAAVKIQSAYRRYVCASNYLLQKSSVVVIQAEVRRYFARRSYLNLRHAASMIQRRFRAQRDMQEARQCFILQRKACIVLQTWIRKWQCRRRYNAIRSAAITIQQHFRAGVKSYTQREGFLQLRGAAVVLQSYWRMSSARRKYKRAQDAAIKIQAFARMTKGVRAYQKLKNATISLQKIYKANHLCKRQRQSYEMMRLGAIVIQSHLRGFRARQRVAEMLLEKQRRRTAALKIQRYYRGFRLMEKTHFTYHVTRGAIITLQSAFRMVRAQKLARRLRAVVKIQAAYRGTVKRRNFLSVREVVCRLQATVRRNQTRKQFVRTRKSTVAIQQRYRAQVAMRKISAEYECLRRSIVLIQLYYRGYCQRKSYLCDRQKVVLVQSLVRMHLQRTKFLHKRTAVIVIQCRYRSFIIGQGVRLRFHLMKWAVTRIQSFYRGCLVRAEVKKLRSAILIQSHARGMIQRQKYYHAKHVVIRIQALTRAWYYRKSYLKLKAATVFLQRKVRAQIASRKERREFQEIKRAAVTLQSFYRGRKARYTVRQLKAVIQIQRWFRGILAGRTTREEYERLKDATVILQAAFRGYRVRMAARKMFAARVIQAAFRGFITRRKIKFQKAQRLVQLNKFASVTYLHLKAIKIQRCYRRARAIAVAKARMDAVLLIQCWWRGVLEHRRFTTLRSAAVIVQRAARRKLVTKNKSAVKIQSLIRGVLARNHLRKLQKYALRIQALWRGYRVRREESSLKVKRARKRIKSANAAATESMKLCNRTRSALDFLLQCKNISKIVGALVNLEVVTRLSEVCCQQVVKDGALPVIFKVIKKCNRSLPHLEVIKYSISILFNVAKYPSVYYAVYEQPDSIETLVELLANFRDKTALFAKTCCLLVVLCRDSSITQHILNMAKTIEDIKSVHKIAERNHRLEAKRNKVNEKSACQFAPPTPYKGKKSNPVKWQRRLDMVQDPLEAVRLLVRKLGLAGFDE